MGLKSVLSTLDELSEEQKAFYKEDGDRFILDIEGIDDHPAVRGVITANNENRKKRDAYKAQAEALAKRLDGLPEDFDAAAYEHLKEIAEGKGGQPTEDQINAVRDKVRQTLEKKHADEIATRDARIEKLNGSIRRMIVDGGLRDAMDKAGIDGRHAPKLIPYLKGAAKIGVEEADDGSFKAFVDTELGTASLEKFVSDWAAGDDGKLYVTPPTGPNPKGGARGGAGKTITRTQFDALPQHERAQRLKDGVTIQD